MPLSDHRFLSPVAVSDLAAFSDFRTGEPIIDRWVARHGKYALKYRSAAIYVSTTQDGSAAGFYTLSPFTVNRDALSGHDGRNRPGPVPAILIGRLGVDERHQGLGLGKALLADAILTSRDVSGVIGACGIVVHPIPGKEGFYSQAGFSTCKDPGEMYLGVLE